VRGSVQRRNAGALVLCGLTLASCGSAGTHAEHHSTASIQYIGHTDEIIGPECRGVTTCRVLLTSGEQFLCIGHPTVVLREGPRIAAVHTTCRQVASAVALRHTPRRVVRCLAGALEIAPNAQKLSLRTQEQRGLFILTNRSRTPCFLKGYPRIGLYAGQQRLQFSYTRGEREHPNEPAHTVLLRPGADAFVVADKGSCERVARQPTRVIISLPDGGGVLDLHHPKEEGNHGLESCLSPHETLHISPVLAKP
jgi:hypothetical protein